MQGYRGGAGTGVWRRLRGRRGVNEEGEGICDRESKERRGTESCEKV